MCSGFLMTVVSHVNLFFGCPFEIFLVYNYGILYCVSFWCMYLWCMLDFALMVVLKSYIKHGWLIYLLVCQKEFISGRLVNICSVGCNHCKYLILPEFSWTSKALSEIFLQSLKLGLYLESKVSIEVWFLKRTISPILKFVLLGSLMGGRFLSWAIFKFRTAFM